MWGGVTLLNGNIYESVKIFKIFAFQFITTSKIHNASYLNKTREYAL